MIFIVSQVDLEAAGHDGAALEIAVTRAGGQKCARCWRMVPSVSSDEATDGLCERCVDALAGARPS
jgi:isoleucyl-tRNA synthetase